MRHDVEEEDLSEVDNIESKPVDPLIVIIKAC